MKLSLSTNWCNRRIETGEEIAERALALGFDELELGFHTTLQQAEGFRKVRHRIPIGSVHAFCPVPLSAPQGYPELYSLASFDENDRAIARVHILRNIRFAADIGADTVVLHAGRVPLGTFLRPIDSARLSEVLVKAKKDTNAAPYRKLLDRARTNRLAHGQKMLDLFKAELDKIAPTLRDLNVTLALENMPYYEGFPLKEEMDTILGWGFGDSVKAWFDTGHAHVCHAHGWTQPAPDLANEADHFAGMHLNDVKDLYDDHLAPGFGSVNFASLRPLAEKIRHVVFEPCATVSEEDLLVGIANIRKEWELS